jgi:hypothetical protein
MSLAEASIIGRDFTKRKRGRAVAQCGVQPLLMLLRDVTNLGKRKYGKADCDTAFHGHVAHLELALAASTSSIDHSHTLLRLVQHIQSPITNMPLI